MKHLGTLRRYLDGRLRKELAAAAQARAERDWPVAERHYLAALARDSMQPATVLQLGHAQREMGRLEDSEATYRRAIALRPVYPQGYLYLGHALKAQGHTSAAIDAYAQALTFNPGFKPARDELISLGARNRLPEQAYGRSASTESLGRISSTLESGLAEMRQWLTVSAYPVQAYDAFRRAFPIQPPPAHGSKTIILLLDATLADPSALRRTLASALDQRHDDWIALVRTRAALQDHSIASAQFVDSRIRFVGPAAGDVEAAIDALAGLPVLLAPTGSVLNRETIGWMGYALDQAHGLAVTCDYDHHHEHWRTGLLHLDPALEGASEPADADPLRPPPAALIMDPALRNTLSSALAKVTEEDQRREVARLAQAVTSIGRLPRILLSLPDNLRFTPPAFAPAGAAVTGLSDETPAPILIVIPTRDQPAMLAGFVDSLIRLAARPKSLQIVIVDNRSVLTESRVVLSRLSRIPGVKVLAVDEPFNWSRLNNLGASEGRQEILLFANDDMEMLSAGWDQRLRQIMASEDVGVVGARLLYPSGVVQHAGTILGGHDARPVHEGVGTSADTPGPLGRWVRTRRGSSTTGAFLATRRGVFEKVGGFSPRLSIAYNDIDYCLKVRSQGLQIVYAGDIRAVHHESVTRGLNTNAEKIAWDDGELTDLYGLWGENMTWDPTVNPQWTSAAGRPFEGFRDLNLSQILDHLRRTSQPNPWITVPRT